MDDPGKTREQLITELNEQRSRVAELERLHRSEHQRAEKALLESEERYRDLFDGIKSGAAVYEACEGGADFIIRDINRAAERIEKVEKKDILGKKVTEVFPGIREMSLLKTLQKVWGSGMSENHPVTIYRDERSIGWRENFVYKLPSGEVVAVYEDVTERKQSEEALRESEDVMRYIIKHDPNAVAVYDNNLTYIAVSDRYLHDYNVKEEDILGRHHYDVFPEMPQRWKDVHSRCLAGEIIRNDDDSFERPDGSITYNRWECRPWYRGDNEIGGMITYTEVTTERKKAEMALRESEARFRLTFDRSPVGAVIVSLDGRFLQANEAFLRFVGYGNSDLLSLKFKDITHPDDIMHDLEQVRRLHIGEIEQYVRDKRYIRKDGEIVWGHLSSRLLKDMAGEPLYFLSIIIDITERKQAEEHLRRHETQYRAILTATMDGFSLCDREGRFLDVNDHFCGMLGYSREEMLSLSVFDVSTKEEEQAFRGHSANIRERGFDRFETAHTRKNGVAIETEVSVNYVPSQDCFISFYRDLTEKKKLEEQFRQSQKMESVGRLAGGVAHDFNNILTAIIGNTELSRMSISPSDPVYQDIVEIGKAAERAANLTRQLLAFSRKQIISPKVMNLNEVILDMDKMLRRIIGEHIEYRTQTCPDLQAVSMDPGQVEQVLTNLVVNSRDAMPQGGKLTIETGNIHLGAEYAQTHPETEPGDYVMLAVSDSGTGMDAVVLSHLFEPFFTTKPRGSGTGLGLSTCYGIVKQNRGAISVYSEPGHGTAMKIYLPAVPEPSADRPESGAGGPGCRGDETILVVEDEPAVRSMIVRVLEERGYTVLTAGDGAEALDVSGLHTGAIHLVVTDIIMPRMGGKELSAKIIERRSATKVLFMSGYTDNSIVHHGVLDKGVEFIQKPFSPISLVKKVRKMLDGGMLPHPRPLS